MYVTDGTFIEYSAWNLKLLMVQVRGRGDKMSIKGQGTKRTRDKGQKGQGTRDKKKGQA